MPCNGCFVCGVLCRWNVACCQTPACFKVLEAVPTLRGLLYLLRCCGLCGSGLCVGFADMTCMGVLHCSGWPPLRPTKFGCHWGVVPHLNVCCWGMCDSGLSFVARSYY